jgi:hypothetical protein
MRPINTASDDLAREIHRDFTKTAMIAEATKKNHD